MVTFHSKFHQALAPHFRSVVAFARFIDCSLPTALHYLKHPEQMRMDVFSRIQTKTGIDSSVLYQLICESEKEQEKQKEEPLNQKRK
jgi:hypothetical protein